MSLELACICDALLPAGMSDSLTVLKLSDLIAESTSDGTPETNICFPS